MINEGGNIGWERFRKRQGKTLRKILNKMRKQEKNKALQFKRFGSKTVAKDAVRARESFGEGIGAAYMPQADKAGVPEREITSKAVKKQLNRSRNRNTMKGDLETPHVRYIHSRDKSTDYIRPEKRKKFKRRKTRKESFSIVFKEADGCWDGYKKAGMKKKGKKLVPNCVPESKLSPDVKSTMDSIKKQQKARRDAINKYTSKGQLPPAGTIAKSMSERTSKYPFKDITDKLDKIAPKPKGASPALKKYVADVNKRRKEQGFSEEYPPGAEADMMKRYKHKTPSSKTVDAMYKDYKNNQKLKKVNMVGQSSHHNEGTYDNYSKRRVPPKVQGDNIKHQMRPKGMSAGEAGRRKLAKVAQGDQNRKLAKAYGIREAVMDTAFKNTVITGFKKEPNKNPKMPIDDIKKRLQNKSNRVKDAAMAKKMNKVLFRHRESVNEDLSKADKSKMDQLFRMGLAKKGELAIMQRAMKRGPDAMKDPKLRSKLYDLLVKLTDLVTKDGQTFVKVRQNVQRNKKELQAVKELLHYRGKTILEVNKSFELINIPEDMSGMSVSSGHKRSVKQGAGMTKKGVAAYRRRNPGSKLQTAVTTPPSKLKKGSKAANRRKAFCSRSRSWTSERGRAARRRWNC